MRLLDWLLRRRRPLPGWSEEWASSLRAEGHNPVHDYMWPDCHRPLPHGHHLFTLERDD